jgi:hypothetical protein
MKFTKGMAFTPFLLFFFIGFVLLYFWAINIGSSDSTYYTPFMKLMNKAGCIPGANESISTQNCTQIAAGQSFTGSDIYSAFAVTITSAALVGGVVGLIFPNPWAIFAGVTMTLATFLTLPLNLFDDAAIPMPIKFSIFGLYIVATIALISWFRGGGNP